LNTSSREFNFRKNEHHHRKVLQTKEIKKIIIIIIINKIIKNKLGTEIRRDFLFSYFKWTYIELNVEHYTH